MKIKNIITYASASAFALCIASCTRGFIDMNEDPFQGPYVPGTEKPIPAILLCSTFWALMNAETRPDRES